MASTTSTDPHRDTSDDDEDPKFLEQPEDPSATAEDSLDSTSNIPEIVQKYEKMFADRFTVKDEEYQKYVQRPADSPPIIEDWRGRSGGHQRYQDRFRDNRPFKGRGDRSNWQGGYRSNRWQERSSGNNYSQGERSYPQAGQYGHSSYSQRSSYGYH